MRVAVVATGSDIGTPMGWAHYEIVDGTFKQVRFEPNPDYVAPPPPTERERVEQEIYDLEQDLASARKYLATLTDE